MRDDGVLLQSLARGLQNMQNISSIVYSPHQHHIPVERKALSGLPPRGALRNLSPSSRFTPPDHPFRQLIGAIFLTGYTGIRQLTIRAHTKDEEDARFWPAVFSLAMFTFPDPNDLRAGQHLFLHLTRVHMSVCLGVNSVPDTLSTARLQQLENFAKLLQTAKDLRHLSLSVLDMRYSVFASEHVLFGSIGLRETWLRLRSLSLEGMSANKEDVMEMITQHKDTLRALHLSDFILCTGNWEDIVNEVVFNASMIDTFTLHQVNEGFTVFDNGTFADRNSLRFGGELIVGQDGERHFVCTNSVVFCLKCTKVARTMPILTKGLYMQIRLHRRTRRWYGFVHWILLR